MSRAKSSLTSQLKLDDERCAAFWKGQCLVLSRDSYRVLRLIASNPHRTYTAGEIVEDAGIGSDTQDTEVQKHFQLLKKAFLAGAKADFPIKVVPRQGYKWNDAPPQTPRSSYKTESANCF